MLSIAELDNEDLKTFKEAIRDYQILKNMVEKIGDLNKLEEILPDTRRPQKSTVDFEYGPGTYTIYKSSYGVTLSKSIDIYTHEDEGMECPFPGMHIDRVKSIVKSEKNIMNNLDIVKNFEFGFFTADTDEPLLVRGHDRPAYVGILKHIRENENRKLFFKETIIVEDERRISDYTLSPAYKGDYSIPEDEIYKITNVDKESKYYSYWKVRYHLRTIDDLKREYTKEST